jgi:hypothetical protein
MPLDEPITIPPEMQAAIAEVKQLRHYQGRPLDRKELHQAIDAGPKGYKLDDGKSRVDLIPTDVLEEIGFVLGSGAKKYEDRNWERGMSWSRVYGAAIRHLYAYWKGENNDPETGRPHLAHAACCVLFLLAYQLRKTGLDDRHKVAKG